MRYHIAIAACALFAAPTFCSAQASSPAKEKLITAAPSVSAKGQRTAVAVVAVPAAKPIAKAIPSTIAPAPFSVQIAIPDRSSAVEPVALTSAATQTREVSHEAPVALPASTPVIDGGK